ncbi:MAG: NAD(+)/NADH kinase [Fimbriimonadaceae bacterium]
MRINLVVNTHRRDAIQAARDIAALLGSHGIDVGAEMEAAGFLGVPAVPDDEVGKSDAVVCFGGDGTLIRAAHLCSENGTPILGVYFGSFGFVTQCLGNETPDAISALLEGKLKIEERMMLRTELLRSGEPIATIHALNEVVLQRAVTARMMIFGVTIDGSEVTRYPADGVIVSTPTGSTAYNLSAGGPIVDPEVQAMLLTAIAPHTLSARSLVLKPQSEVRLRLRTEGDAVLSADGQTRLHLLTGDEVRVVRSERVTRLIQVDGTDFLFKLRERLFYGQSVARGPS